MKYLWVFISCLIGSPLLAERIENVEFEFPPSISEWKLLLEWNEPVSRDNDQSIYGFKLFTHRGGDALELFSAICMSEEEYEEEDIADNMLYELLSQYFPNHRIAIHKLENKKQSQLTEWEWNDGFEDLMHGITRKIKIGPHKVVLLSYMTTARRDESDDRLWKDVLTRAATLNR